MPPLGSDPQAINEAALVSWLLGSQEACSMLDVLRSYSWQPPRWEIHSTSFDCDSLQKSTVSVPGSWTSSALRMGAFFEEWTYVIAIHRYSTTFLTCHFCTAVVKSWVSCCLMLFVLPFDKPWGGKSTFWKTTSGKVLSSFGSLGRPSIQWKSDRLWLWSALPDGLWLSDSYHAMSPMFYLKVSNKSLPRVASTHQYHGRFENTTQVILGLGAGSAIVVTLIFWDGGSSKRRSPIVFNEYYKWWKLKCKYQCSVGKLWKSGLSWAATINSSWFIPFALHPFLPQTWKYALMQCALDV